MPSRFCRSISRLMICAWIETSSAETGSSHTISFGSSASARAMPRRCRWPPENSCGYCASSRGRSPTRSKQLCDALARVPPRRHAEIAQRLADDRAGRHARIERRVRVLEDDLHALAMRPELRARQRGHVRRRRAAPAPPSARSGAGWSWPAVDLPQPDSPTRPSVSPWPSSERNAVDGAALPAARRSGLRLNGKYFFRSRTSSSGDSGITRPRSCKRRDLVPRRRGPRARGAASRHTAVARAAARGEAAAAGARR